MRAKLYYIINRFIKNIYFIFKYNIFFPNYYIGKRVRLDGLKNITIGKKSFILDYSIINTFPNPYGNPYRKKHSKGTINILSNTRIKNFVQIYSYDGFIKIGNNCTINSYCTLYGNGGITIGNNVLIATGTTIVASNYIFNNEYKNIKEQGLTKKGITIGNNVWIAANCTIIDGTIIPDGVVIGANSLVRGVLEENSIYAGIPAKKIKNRVN